MCFEQRYSHTAGPRSFRAMTNPVNNPYQYAV